jgi:hypothetical protein
VLAAWLQQWRKALWCAHEARVLEHARLVASSLFILRFERLSLCLALFFTAARPLRSCLCLARAPSLTLSPPPPTHTHKQTQRTHTPYRFREIRRRMLAAWSQQAHNQGLDRALEHRAVKWRRLRQALRRWRQAVLVARQCRRLTCNRRKLLVSAGALLVRVTYRVV